jgi:hypothetical protein
LFATLIALITGIGNGEARASAASDPVMLEATPGNIEERIEAMIHRWFAVLEDPTVEAKILNGLLAEAPFELILDGEALRDRGELLAWVSNLRATYSQIVRSDADATPVILRMEERPLLFFPGSGPQIVCY